MIPVIRRVRASHRSAGRAFSARRGGVAPPVGAATLKAVSLFSGVGGIDLAFERAGVETVLQAERDKWCNEVLARHWPQTARVDDVRGVTDTAVTAAQQLESNHRGEHVDLVYGGPPCQPFSVAGKRGGADDERDGWPEFIRVVSVLRPRWIVAENVVGLVSLAQGRYFGRLIDQLVQLGYGVAWRTLDAQFFGVPQRRRRVFLVGTNDPGGRAGSERAAQVLSLCEGCGGHPAPRGETGQGVAGTLGGGAGSRGWSPDTDRMTFVAAAISASAGHHGHSSPRGDGSDNLVAQSVALRGRDGGATAELGDNQANALRSSQGGGDKGYVMAIRTAQTGSNGWGIGTDEQAYTLDGAQGQAVIAPPDIAWALQADTYHHGGYPNQTMNGDNGHVLPMAAGGVRRLTPRECNRLQGFPDDWDRWTADGREIADSHRYRMMGNAVCVPVVEWIARRLVAVDAVLP